MGAVLLEEELGVRDGQVGSGDITERSEVGRALEGRVLDDGHVERLQEVGEVRVGVSLRQLSASASLRECRGRTRVASSQSSTPMISGFVGWKIWSR